MLIRQFTATADCSAVAVLVLYPVMCVIVWSQTDLQTGIYRFLERKLSKELCASALWSVELFGKLEFIVEFFRRAAAGGEFRPAGRDSFQTIGKNPKDRRGPRPSGLRFRVRST